MASKQKLINTLVQNIIAECQMDYDGLWRIVKHVKEDGIATQPAEVRKETYNVVSILLDNGIVAGNFHHKNPQIYNVPVDKIIAMIEQEWGKLSHEPAIGEVMSFTSKKYAKKLGC